VTQDEQARSVEMTLAGLKQVIEKGGSSGEVGWFKLSCGCAWSYLGRDYVVNKPQDMPFQNFNRFQIGIGEWVRCPKHE
jgi:hypothetical protein